MQFGGYIVPRGPTGTLNHGTPALLKKALTLVGIGAKGLSWFEFGPEPMVKSRYFLDLRAVRPANPKSIDTTISVPGQLLVRDRHAREEPLHVPLDW